MPNNPPTTRSRVLYQAAPDGYVVTTSQSGSNPPTTTSARAVGAVRKGRQNTVSEGHPFRSRPKGFRGDLGGDFFTQREYVEGINTPSAASVKVGSLSSILRISSYTGPIFPINPVSHNWASHPQEYSSNEVLNAAGATAVKNCKPTNSVANAATFLGELYKDGIPHLVGHTAWKDRTLNARNASQEFLNSEFGWKPLVSDVRSFAYAVRHADIVLRQYERDAGKLVRRHFSFPTTTKRVDGPVSQSSYEYMNPVNTDFQSPTTWAGFQKTTEVTQRRWFSGAFTYHLPTGSDSRSKMGKFALMADKLLGLSLTPETLWNLAPWSWAVDWFSNTGDVVSNISDWTTDGLVMQYGYMMENTIERVTYASTSSGFRDQKTRATPLVFVRETKIRRRANPFGFGVTWSGLSPLQVLIASAIGLTR